MQEDNVMPGQPFYPREPQAQVRARRNEKAKILQGLVLVKEVIARLDERIAFYASVDAIPKEVKADPVKFMNMHNANELTRNSLRLEKEYLEGLIQMTEK